MQNDIDPSGIPPEGFPEAELESKNQNGIANNSDPGVTQFTNTGSGVQVAQLSPTGDANFEAAEIQVNSVSAEQVNVQNMQVSAETLAEALRLLGVQFSAQGTTTTLSNAISHAVEWASLSDDTFCLFVLDNEKFNQKAFSMHKSRSLEKYTSEENRNKYKRLTLQAIEEIKHMPCIFAKRNEDYKSTSATHPAILGRITDISIQDENIRFEFDPFLPIPQQLINNNIEQFKLANAPLRNELDEEHWSIRSGNLKEIVSSHNIVIV